MPLLSYTLDLDQPLLATGRVSDPNSNTSLDYVPGSLLRGLLIYRYCQAEGLQTLSGDTLARALFLDGTVRYLHAYPAGRTGERTLPAPRTLRVSKRPPLDEDNGRTAYDSGCSDGQKKLVEAQQHDQFVPLDAPFVERCEANNALITHTPLRTISIHVQRDRVMGRATAERGAVFQYQALAEGQRFTGLILIDDGEQADRYQERLMQLAAEPVGWLGGSRSAGYGRVRLALNPTQQPEAPTLPEEGSSSSVSLTLLSDTLLLDATGQPLAWADPTRLPAALAAALSEAAGEPVTVGTVYWQHSSVGRVLVGGYNSTWRLPLPPTPALAAGSVLTFDAQLGPQARSRINWRGLGLRRAEGYGRCALDLPSVAQPTIYRPEDPLPEASDPHGGLPTAPTPTPNRTAATLTIPLSPMAEQLARRMGKRRLEQAVDAHITLFLHRQALARPPRRSQLAWLATETQQALNGDDGQLAQRAGRLRGQLADLREAARQQFERASVGAGSLLQWLLAHLDQPSLVWQTLKIDPAHTLRVAGVEPSDPARDVEAIRAVLRLVAAAAGYWRKQGVADERAR
ncbi:MAG TPA: RAMP superfamily CRISPR-associated protein [Roseiflexaceae bacterium]|nr:RAMP superfamily CRISPR-associated protein [Roseiflexaceae bacterium]